MVKGQGGQLLSKRSGTGLRNDWEQDLGKPGTENLVNCIVGKACMLPCRFSAAGSEVIHWYRGDTVIHSFYYGQDQLAKQNLDFHNRTSLFENQIASGNASLLLRGVKIQDGGRYRCYSSTSQGSQEFFIHLKVSG
ncbi:hypothetical protein Z043_125806 [Scleropages formosus]|uniref:Ig-like domain-containing protein n=1 Tax=Scleropages formosus TaxID=113540 RepID=A0A0P7T6K9_SCLFO|nr:hypothetical protein Z043_125806 [Scleropages formosus]